MPDWMRDAHEWGARYNRDYHSDTAAYTRVSGEQATLDLSPGARRTLEIGERGALEVDEHSFYVAVSAVPFIPAAGDEFTFRGDRWRVLPRGGGAEADRVDSGVSWRIWAKRVSAGRPQSG